MLYFVSACVGWRAPKVYLSFSPSLDNRSGVYLLHHGARTYVRRADPKPSACLETVVNNNVTEGLRGQIQDDISQFRFVLKWNERQHSR